MKVEMTVLGSKYESCLEAYDRNYAIFTWMFGISVIISDDSQVRHEISSSILMSFFLMLEFLSAEILNMHRFFRSPSSKDF